MNTTVLDQPVTLQQRMPTGSRWGAFSNNRNGRGPDDGTLNGSLGGSSGDVFLDASNICTLLYHANGGCASAAVSAIDLIAIRSRLRALFGLRRFHYVVAENGHRDRSARRRFVERCHWRFVEARRSSLLNRDPADVFIIERILAATSQLRLTGRRTIVLISHDGDFAEPCRRFLAAGGRLVLAGFLGCFSRKLYALGDHACCDVLDLHQDLQAVDATAATPHPLRTL